MSGPGGPELSFHRRGFSMMWRRRFAGWIVILAVSCPALGLAGGQVAKAVSGGQVDNISQGQVRQIPGESRIVRVPMVSEPWSATVGRVVEGQGRTVPDFGDFPGFDEWKRQANERRKAGARGLARTTDPYSDLQIPVETLAGTSVGSGVVFEGPSES